jgi:hypothetical protein
VRQLVQQGQLGASALLGGGTAGGSSAPAVPREVAVLRCADRFFVDAYPRGHRPGLQWPDHGTNHSSAAGGGGEEVAHMPLAAAFRQWRAASQTGSGSHHYHHVSELGRFSGVLRLSVPPVCFEAAITLRVRGEIMGSIMIRTD